MIMRFHRFKELRTCELSSFYTLMVLMLDSSHGNESNPYVDGGDFVFWPHGPKGEKYAFRAKHNSAIIVGKPF